MYPELPEGSQRYVVETIAEFLDGQARSLGGTERAA
jgi:hypothetical protein